MSSSQPLPMRSDNHSGPIYGMFRAAPQPPPVMVNIGNIQVRPASYMINGRNVVTASSLRAGMNASQSASGMKSGIVNVVGEMNFVLWTTFGSQHLNAHCLPTVTMWILWNPEHEIQHVAIKHATDVNMEFLTSALATVIAELGKCFCGCAFSKIENFAKFQLNFDNLIRERGNLNDLRTSVQVIIAEAKRDGHELPNRARVNEWREQVEKLDEVVASFIEASTTNNNGETLSKRRAGASKTGGAKSPTFSSIVPNRIIPGPSVQPSVPSKSLDSVLKSLNREDVNRIGVWGMGGVGKTTLVRTLNNTPSFMQPFSMVIWVTVSKQFDKRRVQLDSAKRLKLDRTMEEGMECIARKIFRRLQLEEKLLLILDDVWEAVDLDRLGVPEPDDCPGWKLLLTSRSLDEDIKVEVLDDEESWKLFTQNAGKVVNLENTEQVAKQVGRECGVLPLLINIVSASMRGKEMVQLWENALSEMQRSRVPNINGIHNKELVQSWLAEGGLIDELRSYEESTNRGIALIENLKDSCLLERGIFYAGNVKMHDVVRDLASWISSSSSSEDGCKAFVRSGLGLTNFPEVETPDSVKRVSFMHNAATNLPESVAQCPEIPNLELLALHRIRHLESVAQLASPLGLECSELRKIEVFSVGGSASALEHLVSIGLFCCKELEELFAYGSSSANPLPHPVVFNLRSVSSVALPNLEHLSGEIEL
ncbi:hypothetical protein RJ640_002092 [Escallonia rubra]|uniref:NB-ARC domain-containing protein n=1 Tax=Escallonia rubra TaxID=112253 RepID=A0AA88QKE7_9ASTE|nr:hypothetical protein RJ640_002092 [Escallonia rubra]